MHVPFELKYVGKENRVEMMGPQRIVLTNATHVHCEGDVNINNVLYRHSTHLYRAKDGTWTPESVMKNNGRYHKDSSIMRPDWSEVTPAAQKKANEIIPVLLSNALVNMDQIKLTTMRKQAEQEKVEQKLNNVRASIKELHEKLVELDQQEQKLATTLEAIVKNSELPEVYDPSSYG